jgi:hypothetical protein
MQADLVFQPSQSHPCSVSSEMVLPAAIIAKMVMFKCARLSHYLESVVD